MAKKASRNSVEDIANGCKKKCILKVIVRRSGYTGERLKEIVLDDSFKDASEQNYEKVKKRVDEISPCDNECNLKYFIEKFWKNPRGLDQVVCGIFSKKDLVSEIGPGFTNAFEEWSKKYADKFSKVYEKFDCNISFKELYKKITGKYPPKFEEI